jgi:predicted RNase H-like HicB family nuclease
MKKQKTGNYYKKLLPLKITLKINKTDNGDFWVKIKEFPHCYTQAKDFPELVEMINDAIYTHLEIPKKFIGKLGYYVPKEVINEVKRQRWQKAVRELIKSDQIKRKSGVFELTA